MTPFRKWQKTRRESSDLGADLEAIFYGAKGEEKAAGYIYDGDTHIKRLPDGKFYLLLHREDWISDNLEELECILFAWCVTEFPEDFGIKSVRVHRFLDILQRWIGLDKYAEVMRRNAAETCPDVCHSHDFCDANMAMLEALNNRMDLRAMNQTWNTAKKYMTL